MDEDLKKIELETARVRLERERLLLQKEMGSSKPKPSKLRRYLVGTSLALLCIVGYGIYTVGENNRCDSWRHSRWSELLSEELKKDPAKYEQYMATVGQIRFGEAPETWAGATTLFSFILETAVARASTLADRELARRCGDGADSPDG